MGDEVRYLARTYFHQDYDLDAPTPFDLIREFRDEEPPKIVQQLINDIDSLLVVANEFEARRLWLDEYGASYEPDRDGMTYREWFERVLEVLREPR